MASLKEALFYTKMADGRVCCTLCPHDCKIREGRCGACGVRVNRGGVLYTLVYDTVVSRVLDPIEKKPLFHFQPGSTSYSIATVGCNLRCLFCQNWEISQWPKGKRPLQEEADREAPDPVCPQMEAAPHRIIGEHATPQQILATGDTMLKPHLLFGETAIATRLEEAARLLHVLSLNFTFA